MRRIASSLTVLVFLTPWLAAAPLPVQKEEPRVAWSVIADQPADAMNSPLVVNDLVVVGTDRGALRAFRAETGKEVWTHHLGKRIYHRPATDGERVFFTGGKEITTVTADAGKKIWSFALTHNDAPVLALRKKGLVFTADHDGALHALDAKTGAEKWSADFATDAPKDPPGFTGDQARFTGTKARPSSLMCDGESIFLSVFDQCRVVAFSAATGDRRWAFQTEGWILGKAVSTQTHLFIGSQDKNFYAVNKKTGKQAWKFATKARVESGGAVDDTYVYFGS